jgi:uncharacterized repeat protein (TIGR01451 family)
LRPADDRRICDRTNARRTIRVARRHSSRRGLFGALGRCCLALVFTAALLALSTPPRVVPEALAQNAGGATLEVIPAGSLVIPMDNSLQNIGAVFNLRSYGTVERLLWAGIPVKWVIQSGKAKDGIDFTVAAQRLYPSAVASATRNFSGGPFVVHRDLAAPARSVISAYATANNVAVYETTADVTVSVRHTLTHKPKVAVFNDGGSASIHTDYLAAAGFISGTHYDVIPAATLVTVNASACFTIGTEPHYGATGTAADPQVNAVRQFVQSGGNFLAECEGVITYENNVNFGRYQTTNGMVEGNVRTGIQYPNPDLPYSQFVGAMADVGGSIRDFQPASGGNYRAGAEMHARSPSGSIGGGAAGVLPAKATVSRLSGPSVGGFVFYLGGHQYTTGDLGNINGIRMYLNAVMTPSSRPSNCGLTVTQRTISGTIYEDVNGDSVLTDGVPRPNVAVRLYQDANNNGSVDAADTFLIATTTDASGQYSFQVAPEATGANYLVAVNSKTVTASAGLVAGRGDVWAEQTYGDNSSTAALDLGSRFGGVQAGTSDNFNAAATAPASNAYQHLARVSVSAADASDVNFGFSFNAVTNTRGGDNADDDATSTTRSVQGSLRQFIQNANAVAGPNQMRFVPAVAANAGSYWRVTVTTALAAIIDADTTLDGRAYSSANGTAINDANAGMSGAGGTVGVSALALAQVARPELEILDGAGIAIGLDLQAANATVRRLAVYGFGTAPNSDTNGNLRVGNVSGALIEENVLGAAASGFADPGATTRSIGDNLRVAGGDGGTIRNNLIGFSHGKGIQLGGGANGWTVTGNEVRGNGIGNSNLDGVDVENGSGSATITGNLFVGNEAAGIDTFQSAGSNTIENNTITGNGIGPNANIESPGIRLYGTGSVVRLNVVASNFGAGVAVTSGSTSNLITRNSIFANGTITNKAGAGPSNQIGIDLLSAANNQQVGTAPFVTANDTGDADAGGNGLLNFPVLTSARVVGANLVLQGYAAAGADIEFFVAAPDPTGFGEGQTYLLTLVEGSGSDTDAGTGSYGPTVGGLNVGTDNASLFRFTVPLPAGVAIGTILTATATISGSTSEFSGNVTVANAPPNIVLEKRCAAPANCETAVQPPGTELTYTITFTNDGGSAASNLTIVDVVPFSVDAANSLIVKSTEFKVGSMTLAPGTTGLSLAPAGILHFSDPINFPAPTPPWTPASAYTPSGAAGTFDPAVTYVGWQLTGTMAPGTSGSVSFTVRIR